jgi:hypothetical protein
MSTEFNMLRDNMLFANNIPLDSVGFSNDELVEKSFSWYSPYCFESLMIMLEPMVQHVVGKPIVPVFSYARIYYNGASMVKHTDREGGEIGVTCTIDIDETPWDIWIEDNKGTDVPLCLNVGDICIYNAHKNNHWRKPYTGRKQVQAFLFYTDVGGENTFDKRPMLGAPGHRWSKNYSYPKNEN